MKNDIDRFLECLYCPHIDKCRSIPSEKLIDTDEGECKARLMFENKEQNKGGAKCECSI